MQKQIDSVVANFPKPKGNIKMNESSAEPNPLAIIKFTKYLQSCAISIPNSNDDLCPIPRRNCQRRHLPAKRAMPTTIPTHHQTILDVLQSTVHQSQPKLLDQPRAAEQKKPRRNHHLQSSPTAS